MMDEIFENVRRTGKLSTRKKDLIRISFARDGSLFWGPNGRHRLAIAIFAGVKRMPAKPLYVHPHAKEAYLASIKSTHPNG